MASMSGCGGIFADWYNTVSIGFRPFGRNLTEAEAPDRAPAGQAETRLSRMSPDQAERVSYLHAWKSYPRKAAPVAFCTAATIAFDTLSMSSSVSVRSLGVSVTAMATDFCPAATCSPL